MFDIIQNTKDCEGYAQNKIFGIVNQEAWFSNNLKLKGVVFEKFSILYLWRLLYYILLSFIHVSS